MLMSATGLSTKTNVEGKAERRTRSSGRDGYSRLLPSLLLAGLRKSGAEDGGERGKFSQDFNLTPNYGRLSEVKRRGDYHSMSNRDWSLVEDRLGQEIRDLFTLSLVQRLGVNSVSVVQKKDSCIAEIQEDRQADYQENRQAQYWRALRLNQPTIYTSLLWLFGVVY